jgi:hypothetical protein
MEFVKLTTWKDFEETFVNFERVKEIRAETKGDEKGSTRVHFDNGWLLYVKETPAEIMKKL